jgi:hypothetical protein
MPHTDAEKTEQKEKDKLTFTFFVTEIISVPQVNLFQLVLRVLEVNLMLLVRFEVSTTVTMKNPIFWDVTTCGL